MRSWTLSLAGSSKFSVTLAEFPPSTKGLGYGLVEIQPVRSQMHFDLIAIILRTALVYLMNAVEIGSYRGGVVGVGITMGSQCRAHASDAINAGEAIAIYGTLHKKRCAGRFIFYIPSKIGSTRRFRSREHIRFHSENEIGSCTSQIPRPYVATRMVIPFAAICTSRHGTRPGPMKDQCWPASVVS